MIIKILNNNDLSIRGVELCKSLQWQRKFTSCGNFEIHLSNACKTEIRLNDIISADKGRLCGIVKRIYFKGGDITICGYDMKGICLQRIDTDRHSGFGGEIIAEMAEKALTLDGRKIPCLKVAASTDGKLMETEKEAKKLSEKIEAICNESDLGYDIEKIGNELIFKVVVPKNRQILFSERRKNISSVETEKNILDGEISCVYTVGETITEFDTGKTGYERTESTGENPEKIIAESKKEEIVTSAVSASGYLTEWDLGDWVNINSNSLWGKESLVQKQITEIREVYENEKITITPTFGKKQKSIFRRIVS